MRPLRIAAVSILALLLAGALSPPASADVSFSFFYSNLEPHGSWAVSGSYGRVWQPSVYAVGWNPYYDGHWVYTDLGWTWVSDYQWGSICYHYGTWVPDPDLGWVWVPGYVWAPAWVVFRTGPDYIGWAPVPPRYSVGGSFRFGDIDEDRFVFVSAGGFLAPRIRTYVVPVTQTRVIINQTRIINNITVENNIVVNRGLDVRDVERISGKRVRSVPIERVERAAPGPRFNREEIRIDPQRARRGVRAAEPVSEREALPAERGRNLQRSKERTEGQAVPDRPRVRERLKRDQLAAERDAGWPSRASTSDVERREQGDWRNREGRSYERQRAPAERERSSDERVYRGRTDRRSAPGDQTVFSPREPQRPGAARQRESVTRQREQQRAGAARQRESMTRQRDSQRAGAAGERESMTRQRERRESARSQQKAGQTRSEKKKRDSKDNPKKDG